MQNRREFVKEMVAGAAVLGAGADLAWGETSVAKKSKVVIVRDGKYVYSTAPNSQLVEFSWRDNQPNKDKTSYYYVRGEQDNGELVWASPLWIKYTGN